MEASGSSSERLQRLGAAFAARLAADAAQLRALATQLDSPATEDRQGVIADVRAIAHRLRGTAPAFDANDIGDAAATLEIAIVDASDDVSERLRSLLALLDTALGAHGPPRRFHPKLG
jgi:HPt (histidine-containing phosphotransfer) domain-containing protein